MERLLEPVLIRAVETMVLSGEPARVFTGLERTHCNSRMRHQWKACFKVDIKKPEYDYGPNVLHFSQKTLHMYLKKNRDLNMLL